MTRFDGSQNGKNNEFRFCLKAGNGETILCNERCSYKSSYLTDIESIKKNAAKADIKKINS
jgi:uncharacterized protein YegP (UPF0339 family)